MCVSVVLFVFRFDQSEAINYLPFCITHKSHACLVKLIKSEPTNHMVHKLTKITLSSGEPS